MTGRGVDLTSGDCGEDEDDYEYQEDDEAEDAMRMRVIDEHEQPQWQG